MNKYSLFLCFALVAWINVQAQMPKWMKKAHQAVFSVVTYDANGSILQTGNGFFIGENGEALSDYTLFKGAYSAVIVTSSGKEMPVDRILGADDMYDVVHFDVETGKEKVVTLSLSSAPLTVGESVWLLPYSTQKEAIGVKGKVTEIVKAAGEYDYYTLQLPATGKMTSLPVTNGEGQVVGLLQQSAVENMGNSCYAVSASYGASLSVGALMGGNSALRSIFIRKALPPTESEALVYLYMQNRDDDNYLNLVDDFISAYPLNAEGYMQRASYYTNKCKDSVHFQLAEADMEEAIRLSDKKHDAYFHYCRLIYQNLIDESPFVYKDWGVKKALDYVNQAISVDSLPLYLQTGAELYFLQRDYERSFELYKMVNRTNMKSASTFFSAARALQLSGKADPLQVVALMDSAVLCYAKPYPLEAAPYIWERGKAYVLAGNYRQAVLDYNEYYNLVGGQVNALFYYYREQAALAGRMNQLALDDIKKAVELEPENVDYLAEKASVCARFSFFDEAIDACKHAIELAPQYADCYRIMGVCYLQKGDKKEAFRLFEQAKKLGDDSVDKLMRE